MNERTSVMLMKSSVPKVQVKTDMKGWTLIGVAVNVGKSFPAVLESEIIFDPILAIDHLVVINVVESLETKSDAKFMNSNVNPRKSHQDQKHNVRRGLLTGSSIFSF